MLLLVSERYRLSAFLAAALLHRGVYLYHASPETAEYFCERKEIGALLLDCVKHPERGAELCRRLRASYPDLPLAVILSPNALLDLPADRILRHTDPEALSRDVADFCRSSGWDHDALDAFELSLTADPDQTVYMGYPLPLSPREHALLRCLFYRSPHATSSDDLMSACYPLERKGIANLPTLVRRINKRAGSIDPRPLIVNDYAHGYRLRDGIV